MTKRKIIRIEQNIFQCPIALRKTHSLSNELNMSLIIYFCHNKTHQDIINVKSCRKFEPYRNLCKGLAYKEVQKLPGLHSNINGNQNSNENDKTLIGSNRSRIHGHNEIQLTGDGQTSRPVPSLNDTILLSRDRSTSQMQTSHDIRDIRKRIVKGSTLSHLQSSKTNSWINGQTRAKSMIGLQVLRSVSNLTPANRAQYLSPIACTSQSPHYAAIHTTPIQSDRFDCIQIGAVTNLSSL
jgi:hypothetical protein